MKALIKTSPRRIMLAMSLMAFSAVAMMILSVSKNIEIVDFGDGMKRFIIIPGLLGASIFLFSVVLFNSDVNAALQSEGVSQESATSTSTPFVAQVVGLEWLNPLHRRDYPTEWQIFWVMGLVQPNKNDDMLRTQPELFNSVQFVATVASNAQGGETFFGFYKKYIYKLLGLFGDRYVMNPSYFYTVADKDAKKWRELAGIHVEFAGPTQLDPLAAQKFLSGAIRYVFNIGNPHFKTLWSKATPPDVRLTSGGPNAGFTSLNAALDYLQANPDKSVWVMNWDAPSFPPNAGGLNENLALLILAGPDMKTDRMPLAWIGKAATGNVADFEPKAGTTRINEAWKVTIAAAAQNANVSESKLNFVVHDAGKDSEAASSRIGALGRTLTETLPDFDFQKQTFNMPALLGDSGTGTALTDVVLAIGRANHLGETVLVAGTTDPSHPVAVVVTPPENVVPIDPNADWFRARGDNNAYLPWWGHRFDKTYSRQGWSW